MQREAVVQQYHGDVLGLAGQRTVQVAGDDRANQPCRRPQLLRAGAGHPTQMQQSTQERGFSMGWSDGRDGGVPQDPGQNASDA